nr:hypothetical protein [Microbispora corallina]
MAATVSVSPPSVTAYVCASTRSVDRRTTWVTAARVWTASIVTPPGGGLQSPSAARRTSSNSGRPSHSASETAASRIPSVPPSPRLAMAATRQAAPIASGLGWVPRASSAARSRRRCGSDAGTAQPTGAIRMAAPLVAPVRGSPGGGGSRPVAAKCRSAARVVGPVPRIRSASALSRSMKSSAVGRPPVSAMSRATSIICAVSSEVAPLGQPREAGTSNSRPRSTSPGGAPSHGTPSASRATNARIAAATARRPPGSPDGVAEWDTARC